MSRFFFCFEFSYRVLEGGLGDWEGVMGCSDTVLFFYLGYHYIFFFAFGFWREIWGTRWVTLGELRRGSRFFSWPDISLRIQYTPVLYSSVLFTIFFFALIFSYMILEGGLGAGRV